MSLIFIIILFISAIFIFRYFYSHKFLKKTTIVNNKESTSYSPCPDNDINSECTSINIPLSIPIGVFSVLIIIIFITFINLYLISTNKAYGAVQGSISAATDISSAFRPSTNVITFRNHGFRNHGFRRGH